MTNLSNSKSKPGRQHRESGEKLLIHLSGSLWLCARPIENAYTDAAPQGLFASEIGPEADVELGSPMQFPCLEVDFNEMVEPNLVLLSQTDQKVDLEGRQIELKEGMRLRVYENDGVHGGLPHFILAEGIAEKNEGRPEWTSAAKWCLRIDDAGLWAATSPTA